jgi:hypothetical protein
VHGNLEVLDESDQVIRVVARYVGVIVAATDCIDGCCWKIGLDGLRKES